MTWGSSYEFWLLSTLETGESRSIIIEEREGEYDWMLPEKKTFFTKWGGYPYEQFNKKYFKFEDESIYVKYRK